MKYHHVIPVACVDAFPAPTEIVFATPGGTLPGSETLSMTAELPFTMMQDCDVARDVSRLLRERLNVLRFDRLYNPPRPYQVLGLSLVVHPCCVVIDDDMREFMRGRGSNPQRIYARNLKQSLRLLAMHPWQAPILDWLFAMPAAA